MDSAREAAERQQAKAADKGAAASSTGGEQPKTAVSHTARIASEGSSEQEPTKRAKHGGYINERKTAARNAADIRESQYNRMGSQEAQRELGKKREGEANKTDPERRESSEESTSPCRVLGATANAIATL